MTYHGYVTSRMFGGISMPVPAQNSCIREFVRNKQGKYILPFLESHFDNCYHQLFSLVNSVPSGDSIIMYSIIMMPNEEKLDMLISKCKDYNIALSFVLEALESEQDFSNIIQEVNSLNLHNLISEYSEIEHYFNVE